MKLYVPQTHIADDEGFSQEKDIFRRKEFGERLAKLIENSNDDLVIALDSNWGGGKTTFIKMWQGYVQHQRSPGFKTFYFDAFQNDYQQDPFLALITELYQLLENEPEAKKKLFKEKASNVAKSLFRGSLKLGTRTATGGLLDGTIIDHIEEDISKLVSEQVDSIIEERLNNSVKDKNALFEFRAHLENIAKQEEETVVFIIDELDRCKPDFALKLIEQIKHLFSVPGITFLLVLNRTQLEESIKSEYGNGINASEYLQKFVNLWLTLPRKIDLEQFHSNDDGVKYVRHVFKEMLNEGEEDPNLDSINLLCELVKFNKPSFREIEQILSYFAVIRNLSKPNTKYYPHYQVIYAFLAYVRVNNPSLFKKINNQELKPEELISAAGLTRVVGNNYIQHLKDCITFDLSDDDIKHSMLEEKRISFDMYHGKHTSMIKIVCNWLTELDIG